MRMVLIRNRNEISDHIIIDGHGAIGREHAERIPLAERVVHGFSVQFRTNDADFHRLRGSALALPSRFEGATSGAAVKRKNYWMHRQ